MFMLTLFLLAEPPLQVILSLLLALVLFGLELWSLFFPQLVELLRSERKAAALANIPFCTGHVL
jgi:hypothetical protein